MNAMKPNTDFCDGCKYLHGDEDGENYYQYCSYGSGTLPNVDKLYVSLNRLECCPIDSGLGVDIC